MDISFGGYYSNHYRYKLGVFVEHGFSVSFPIRGNVLGFLAMVLYLSEGRERDILGPQKP